MLVMLLSVAGSIHCDVMGGMLQPLHCTKGLGCPAAGPGKDGAAQLQVSGATGFCKAGLLCPGIAPHT